MFINKDNGSVINVNKFKRRIMGLTSYFRSAQEELLPKYDKDFDRHIVRVPMSDYQFQVYENYRIEERKNEKKQRQNNQVVSNDILKDPSSTYRIFSRLACNFAMPVPPGRPNPGQFRVVEANNMTNKILGWVKDKYFSDISEIDTDFKDKYNAFMSELSSDFIKKNEKNIRGMLGLYIKDYKNGTTETIKGFALRIGFNIKEGENINKAPIAELLKAEVKEREKPLELLEKEREKLKLKADKARLKKEKEREVDENKKMIAEEKDIKKRNKAITKALERETKLNAKIKAKEQKEQEKKENKQMIAEEKNTRKLLKQTTRKIKAKVVSESDTEDDDDEDVDEDEDDDEDQDEDDIDTDDDEQLGGTKT